MTKIKENMNKFYHVNFTKMNNSTHLFPQISQMYGFSPECRRKCVWRLPAWSDSNL